MNRLIYHFFSVFLFMNSLDCYTQDLVVMSNNDSLEVKIVNEDPVNLYIAYHHSGDTVTAFLNKKSITGHAYGHYLKPVKNNLLYRLKLSVDYGMGFLTGKAPTNIQPQQRAHLNKIRLGHYREAELTVFLTKEIGLGLLYNEFTSGNSSRGVTDEITVHFYGASFNHRAPVARLPGFVTAMIGAGVVRENNYKMIDGASMNFSGMTFGLNMKLGIEYFLFKHLALGAQTGLLMAFINDFDVDTNAPAVNMKGIQNLGRANASLGMKVCF